MFVTQFAEAQKHFCAEALTVPVGASSKRMHYRRSLGHSCVSKVIDSLFSHARFSIFPTPKRRAELEREGESGSG